MVEYAKMKNAELEAILKERGLPAGGKKADMVDKIVKDDEKRAAEAKAPAAKVLAEDEIDWSDDENETEAAKPAVAAPSETKAAESAATVAKAGGEGRAPNSQAVPNQKADVDPAKTDNLTVKLSTEENMANESAKAEENEVPIDYSRGLAASNIDEEIEKRKARAKKFGLNIENDEGLKKLERMKKFGESGPPKGLDEALPERTRKRGREGGDDSGRNKRRGDRFGGRGGRGDRRRDNRNDRREDKSKSSSGAAGWMSEADRKKAEARKNRFAPAATA
ncbi:hypothetical protein CC78DRAFT_8423 [Lojkania enalia]|uniref:SAP domain-containing protein n=1 Tax=Lojkania enalia TaxID=147567 RepID=A0A9P4ND19_9PLEO|nr:hypothetical protein CC78DRAFT_8423 [Didymosphaeria enalia]